VLYTSTGYDGNPTAVSGFVLVPEGEPPADGRKVVAYTHGTVGVASKCAPSLVTEQEQQPLFVEGGDDLLEAGYVVAASDYQGLGTPGPHPYLADMLCAAAETVDLRLLPGVGHIQTGEVAAPDVLEWLADRFAREPAATTCG
jgi:hypothetical protein